MTMKVSITDREAISALSWEALRTYLVASAEWRHADDITGKAEAYQHREPGGRMWEILVPLRRDLADYVSRMADAVTILARIEDRSELDVYEDLRRLGDKTSGVDEATRAAHEKIRRWLTEEHWQVRDVSNAEWPLSLIVTLDGGQTVDIFKHRDHVDHLTVAQRWGFDETIRLRFSALPDGVRRNIIHDIYRDAFTSGLDLARFDETLTEISFRTLIYFDGLTKDALIQRILPVVRLHELIIRTFGRAFTDAGYTAESASKLLHLVPLTGGQQAAAG